MPLVLSEIVNSSKNGNRQHYDLDEQIIPLALGEGWLFWFVHAAQPNCCEVLCVFDILRQYSLSLRKRTSLFAAVELLRTG